ncbi:MAG: enoyl-CoA hydratase-related protein [Bacillota bacterium]
MGDLLLTKQEGVGIVTFNRPERLNALNARTLELFDGAIAELEKDDAVRAVILTGTGRAFIAGADIAELYAMDSSRAIGFNGRGSKIFRRLERMPKPVIAAVNGYALGGGLELALAADIRIASENAVFASPEAGLGQSPGFGGTQRLPRLVGIGLAKEMIFTCRKIDAFEALRIGLVNRVVPPDELMPAAMDMARKICEASPFSIATAKRAIDEGLTLPFDDALELECKLSGACHDTEEQKRRTLAFLNRSKG